MKGSCSECGKDIDIPTDEITGLPYICVECSRKPFEYFTESTMNINDIRCKSHKRLLIKIHETYKEKNAAYGNSFDQSIDRYGYVSALVRMEDKMNRLEQLLLHNATPNDEAAEDTALDLANYAIMVAMKLLDKVKDTKN